VDYDQVLFISLVFANKRTDCLSRKVHVCFGKTYGKLRVCVESILNVLALFRLHMSILLEEILSYEKPSNIVTSPQKFLSWRIGNCH
jgi:hypothetical protein